MKRYYECAPVLVTDPNDPTTSYYVPSIDSAIFDGAGNQIGQWSVIEQDSDTDPTSMIVGVVDFPPPPNGGYPGGNRPSNASVHADSAKIGRHMGSTFSEAANRVRTQHGSIRSQRMHDNGDVTFPGE